MKYIIANWKANKNAQEAVAWIKIVTLKVNSDQNVLNKLTNNEEYLFHNGNFEMV